MNKKLTFLFFSIQNYVGIICVVTKTGNSQFEIIISIVGVNIMEYPKYLLLALALGACSPVNPAFSQPYPGYSREMPGTHPSYLHAVTELQTAQWLIVHRRGSVTVEAFEAVALQNIAKAIGDTRNAAMIDGKNLGSSPPPNTMSNESRRMWLARDNLVQARLDLTKLEENPSAFGARDMAVQDVDQALSAVQQAIEAIEHGE